MALGIPEPAVCRPWGREIPVLVEKAAGLESLGLVENLGCQVGTALVENLVPAGKLAAFLVESFEGAFVAKGEIGLFAEEEIPLVGFVPCHFAGFALFVVQLFFVSSCQIA